MRTQKYFPKAEPLALKRTCSLLAIGSLMTLLSNAASASCTYTVDSEWATGFTANVTIKNDTSTAINNWNVNWKYINNRVSSGWNANVTGTNPYTATNLSWNGSIAVGQSVSFGLQGEKNGGAIERPTVNGTGCSGGTISSASSSRASSSLPPVVSSLARSSSSTQSSLLIEESQAGFCRVDGTIDTNNDGFTGTGFANTNNAQGAAVVWAVESSNSGRQTLTFRYANGGTANRNGSLVINGGTNGNYSLRLPVTSGWSDWQTVSIDVDLVQGNNTLQLSAATAEGLPNIDSLSLTGGSVKAGSCGVVSTSSTSKSSSSSSAPSQACELKAPLKWVSTGPLISPKNSGWKSIKDPSVVKYNGTYHVYATYYDTSYKSMYTSFTDWNSAQQAPHISMTGTTVGNSVAPQVFYFRPHNKWYLITQWGGSYATTDDISKPNWSAKKKLLQGEPTNALDFWNICDANNCYLYFARDDGALYVSKTSIANFPNYSGYTKVMEDHRGNGNQYLFEAPNVYKLDGQNKYLMMVEAYPNGPRMFRSWTSTSLDGPWTALADTNANPFAGNNNVEWPTGKWADGISHGELIRSGYDERLTVDPCNLEFLYQGQAGPSPDGEYNTIPYKLGLLRLKK